MRLSRKRLRQIIQEELTGLSEKKGKFARKRDVEEGDYYWQQYKRGEREFLPPKYDTNIMDKWEAAASTLESSWSTTIGPMLDELIQAYEESPMVRDKDRTVQRINNFKNSLNPFIDNIGLSMRLGESLTEGWQDMSPEADQAYKDIIKVIQDKSKSLNDDDSYNFLVALKDWINRNVM